jgi:hypothetical protein
VKSRGGAGKKRAVKGIMAVAAIMLCLVGCGGSDDGTATADEPWTVADVRAAFRAEGEVLVPLSSDSDELPEGVDEQFDINSGTVTIGSPTVLPIAMLFPKQREYPDDYTVFVYRTRDDAADALGGQTKDEDFLGRRVTYDTARNVVVLALADAPVHRLIGRALHRLS